MTDAGTMIRDDRVLTLRRTIPAPRPRVWAAWTDPVRLPQWWGPRGFTCHTKAIEIREGGAWRFDMIAPDGTVHVNRHRFTRIAPMHAIDYRLDDDGTGDHAFDAEVRFVEVEGGTEVSLRMVFATPDERAMVENFGAVALGYSTLDCLAEAAIEGHALSLTQIYDAPRHKLWAAWTEPERMAHWFYPEGIEIVSSSFEPLRGGSWRTEMRDERTGESMVAAGRFTAVFPQSRIAFTHGWEDDGGTVAQPTHCDLTLADHGHGTRLTFVQTGLGSAGSRDGHAEGWGQTLDHLGRYLDG